MCRDDRKTDGCFRPRSYCGIHLSEYASFWLAMNLDGSKSHKAHGRDMEKDFNLLDESWIPVRMLNGSRQMLGLCNLFAQAREIQALEGSSPANLIALYRVLLVITHRALTSANIGWNDKDRAYWYRHRLPHDAFVGYFERWKNRFWLFHPELPFMQAPILKTAKETKEKLKPWTQISLGHVSGATPTVFDHSFDSAPVGIPAGIAIRLLLGYLQFCPGGLIKVIRSSDKAGPLSNTAAILPLGKNLSETLCLCLHPSPSQLEASGDLPTWEKPAPQIADLGKDPTRAAGTNDRYTRLSRATLLTREPEGTVRWLYFAAGLSLEDDEPDPMAIYRRGQAGPIRFTFGEQREIWRDLSLLVDHELKLICSPSPILTWTANLHFNLDDAVGEQKILVGGLASDRAKLLRWRLEEVILPSLFLVDSQAADCLREQILRAEKVNSHLRRLATKMLSATMPVPHSTDAEAQARAIIDNGQFSSGFFASTGSALWPMMSLISSGKTEEAHHCWNMAILRASEKFWYLVETGLGTSPFALRAATTFRPQFHGLMHKLSGSRFEATQLRTDEP